MGDPTGDADKGALRPRPAAIAMAKRRPIGSRGGDECYNLRVRASVLRID
jgi:hypothetical protein